ncbi:MAG: hypothetical protein M1836_004977 [Candelina mexicana]|nr:MAG: hypothetical protein M1836_004977 [Candelina mexicana]
MPQLAGNSGRMAGADPLLKNLMMSWYYAGYYSGLYEGQKDISNDPMQHQNATGTGVDEKNGSGT